MASRYSQNQHRDRSSSLYGSHPDLSSSNESTQAYDSRGDRRSIKSSQSMQYQQMDRMLPRGSQVEDKDIKVTKAFSRWLGKHKPKNAASTERLRISEPHAISLPQAPLRPKHSINEQKLLPIGGSRILPELESSKPPLRNPSIQKKNLGKSKDALGSYPVGAWLDDSKKTHPPRQILLKSSAEYSEEDAPRVVRSRPSSRITSSSTFSEPEPTRDIKPSLPADVRAERRKGRIFLNGNPSRSLYEFPDPEVWSNEDGDESDDDDDDDDQFWDDAGFDDYNFDDAGFEEAVFESTGEQDLTDGSIPEIIVSSPSDEESESKRRMSSEDLLKPDDVYKVLWKQQTKETRFLNETQRFLLPLAWLVAEAERIDVNDLPALEMALKSIIEDRQKLIDLFPLAKILAKDQKVDVNDFKSLPRMLKNIIADRDNAKRLAEYHRVARRKLESRVAQLEMEKNGESPDDEEYIRY
ncbi:hypothetical protein F4813DRAFT_351634 [Daldinia decipiens]|uniref:uncharacterized protein n=1 Tax=Daldinia decipiens TaxID=326647 RepID=UPI0020C49A8C|nr:uncharacterized protein F4813DRAFT_351634 [Daldinia decipiens]KAI1659676.1 hypothetical protein F4813DRAFT_351634 [Daldinia decipiens]